jgi:HlyD family secretion protein
MARRTTFDRHPKSALLSATVAILLATAGLVVLNAEAQAQEQPAPPATGAPQPNETRLPAIVVTDVVKRHMTDRVIASGTVKPVDEVYIQPLVDGLSVKALNVDIGSEVAANSVLATLTDDALVLQKSQYQANRAKAEANVAQYRAQVVEAEANLDDARRQRDRAQKLSESGTNTQSQVETASAQFEVAQARLNAARQTVSVGESDVKVADAQIADTDLKLARTAVKTPVAGIVSDKNARVGAIANGSGDPLFTVIRDGAIELVADLSETDIQKVRVGQRATVSVAGGSIRIEGKVRLVSPTVDATTRLGAVHVVIDDDTGARAGMFATAEIIVQEKDTLALPLAAVTTGEKGSSARKVENGTVRQVAIRTGIEDAGYVEIAQGLVAGDKVVAKAGAFVRDGDHIRPVAAKPADLASAAGTQPATPATSTVGN